MKRMKCIGAQCVDETELTAPPTTVPMACRRNHGDRENRSFVSASYYTDEPAMSALQMPLFDEPPISARF